MNSLRFAGRGKQRLVTQSPYPTPKSHLNRSKRYDYLPLLTLIQKATTEKEVQELLAEGESPTYGDAPSGTRRKWARAAVLRIQALRWEEVW